MLGGNSTKREVELDELLLILKNVQKDMPVEEEKTEQVDFGKKADKFTQLRTKFVTLLMKTKKDIKQLQDTKSTAKSSDRIKLQSTVRQTIKDMQECHTELEAVVNKERRKRKSKLTDQERAERSAIVNQLKVELNHMIKIFSNGYVGEVDMAESVPSAGGFRIQMSDLLSGSSTGQSGAGNPFGGDSGEDGGYQSTKDIPLTESQQLRHQAILEKEQDQDQELDIVSDQLKTIKEKTIMIGTAIDETDKKLDQVEKGISKAQDKLESLNDTMKKQLESKGAGMERFCLSMICCVILLAIVGVIINVAT